jgi:hypothetical protein
MLSTTTGQLVSSMRRSWWGRCLGCSSFALLAEHGERIVRDEDFADR